MNKREIGSYGENTACEYLINKGYKILERNYRRGKAEVDIICKKDEIVAFVEVKTRRDDTFGSPVESVNFYKTKQIAKVSEAYIIKNGLMGHINVRFDIIGIDHENGSPKIDHIEDAFRL